MIILSTIIFALHGLAVLAETVSMEEENPLILYTDPFEWSRGIADPQASFGTYRFSNIDGNYASITYTFRSFTFLTPRWPRINLKVLIQVDGDPFEVDLQDKNKSPDGNMGPNLGPASSWGTVFRFDGGFMKTRNIKVLPAPRQPNDNNYLPMIVIDTFRFEVDDSFPSGTTASTPLPSSPSPSRPAPTSANQGGIITTTIIGPSGTSIITTSAPTSAAGSSVMSSLSNSGSQSQTQSPMSPPFATHDTLSSIAVNPQSTNPTTLPNATLGLEQQSSKLNIGLVAGLTVMGFALLAVLMCLLLRRLRKRKQLNELARTSQLPEAAHPYPHLQKTGGNIGATEDRLETVGSSEAFTRKLMGWRPRYSLRSPPISAAMQGLSPGARDHADRGRRNEKAEIQTPVESNPTSSVTTSPTSDDLSSLRPLSTDYAPPQFESENSTSLSTTRPLTMDLPPVYSPGDPTRRSLILLQGQ